MGVTLLIILLLAGGAVYYINRANKPPPEPSVTRQPIDPKDAGKPTEVQEKDLDSGHAPEYTLTIDTENPGPAISPMLYGAFFEEINHAGDGGLYAELISNRSFEDHPDTLFNWWIEKKGEGSGNVSLSGKNLLNGVQTRSMKLSVTTASNTGKVSAVNNGYWGIALKEGAEYKLSFYARPEPGQRMSLDVSLESPDGREVYAAHPVGVLKEGWNHYTYTLKSAGTAANARFLITASTPGTVYLDMVSLFPPTWKTRENGLRIDLAEKVAEMKPSFLRFPGGCFVEGNTQENAYRWKTTIGPLETRPGHRGYWNYRSSDGLGFHEYLQWAEDLQAEPLYVAYIGISHDGDPVTKSNTVPLTEIGPWIQDVLDAIEYANGPVTSKWGAKRAANGHPEPFGLKYVEIGNENNFQPAEYKQRYGLFYQAIKAKYPEMNLIANMEVDGEPVELVDEHYYESAEWFMNNASRYDSYDRSGPEIYVGEYAVTKGAGEGNLNAALGEAAFMLGMERNSDIVKMASYAPLFVNTKDRTWNPDAIVFDAASSYGTPSYYVQQMFGSSKGDIVLPAVLDQHRQTDTPQASIQGAVGLGTWSTQAEYDDLLVKQGDRILLEDGFSRNSGRWESKSGNWDNAAGLLRQTGNSADARIIAGDPAWRDYTITLKAKKTGGAEGMLILFGVEDEGNFYWWNIGGWGNTVSAIEKSVGGTRSVIGQSVPLSIESGKGYDIRIELSGTTIRTHLDGKLVHEIKDQAAAGPMFYAASRELATGDVIVKVVNSSEQALTAKLLLKGMTAKTLYGSATVLATDILTDENSFTDPDKAAPVTHRVTGTDGSLEYTFSKFSVTVLRLKEGGL
ncbi:alpha-L-arabinofuranosidase C-terminal domain-containing protein [Paenibacillus sp. CN-4]|uniref:alpha-L-arabinofuranosidase C-terminal domain-containing protein n=1 Tax=Paenibacillus nanchangensis TaxID=3348343 RepID=UPI00397A8D35